MDSGGEGNMRSLGRNVTERICDWPEGYVAVGACSTKDVGSIWTQIGDSRQAMRRVCTGSQK